MENNKIDKVMKLSKAKEVMTVKIIQHNKEINRLIDNMKKTLSFIANEEKYFAQQKEIFARLKMLERVINSGIKMIEKDKIQFFMINDNTLEIDE